MQLHSAATSSSNLTGNADDFQQLPVVQAPGSPGAVTRSARRFFAALHRAARGLGYLLTYCRVARSTLFPAFPPLRLRVALDVGRR